MPQIGPLELMAVAVIALMVFGPRRLPEMARTIGKTLNEFKKQANDLKGQFNADLEDEPIKTGSPAGPGTVVPEPTAVKAEVSVSDPTTPAATLPPEATLEVASPAVATTLPETDVTATAEIAEPAPHVAEESRAVSQ